jgi:hypothetical protein
MESKSRGVLDTPHARGMTTVCEVAVLRTVIAKASALLLFPPPLWGRVREGGGRIGTTRVDPSPQPSPTRGEGAHHRCRDIYVSRTGLRCYLCPKKMPLARTPTLR